MRRKAFVLLIIKIWNIKGAAASKRAAKRREHLAVSNAGVLNQGKYDEKVAESQVDINCLHYISHTILLLLSSFLYKKELLHFPFETIEQLQNHGKKLYWVIVMIIVILRNPFWHLRTWVFFVEKFKESSFESHQV